LRGLKTRLPHAALEALPVVSIVLLAAGLSASYAVVATNWVVMTDELQIARLALSIAETGSPVPRIHGEVYGAPNQLYPLLLAPLFGLLDVPAAIASAHVLNALLLASAAWPAYLLARAVTRSAVGGYVAAGLTAFVPWLVLSTTLLTENAAYAASAWALTLGHRTLAAPSPRHDALALAGVAAAFLARTQLLVLAAVLPAAIVAHELAYAGARAPRGTRRSALREAARNAVASHRLLFAVYAAFALVAGTVLAVTGLRQLFGTYEEAFRGNLFPPGIWRASAQLLDYVVVGVGVAPFLLACSWATVSLVFPQRREAHAFAVLLALLVPILTLQVASFNVRFTAGGFVQDRYLFYLVPPFAVAAAAALLERDRRGLRAALVLVSGVVFALLAPLAPFPPAAAIFWASPASAFHEALATAGGWIDMSPGALVQSGAVVLGAVLALVVWRAPGVRALLATGAALAAFGAVELVYVFERAAAPITTRPVALANVPRDWIDRVVGDGSSVALVPNPVLRPDYWWDAEFWNASVDRVIQTEGTTYTPFPVSQLSLDFRTGAVRGVGSMDVLLITSADTRFRLAGSTLSAAPPLALVRVTTPPRAEWATRGAHPDGWTRPGRPVRVRLFPRGVPGRYDVALTLSAPPEAERGLGVTVEAQGTIRRGHVRGGSAATVELSVCAREGAFAEAVLRSPGGVRIPDGRVVGVHLDAIEFFATRRGC
jgi:hypothetical protein